MEEGELFPRETNEDWSSREVQGTAPDEQVFLLTQLRLHYLTHNSRLPAESTLLKSLQIRAQQRPPSEAIFTTLRDICVFYSQNDPQISPKILSEIDIFTENPEIPFDFRLKVTKAKADLLYIIGQKPVSFQLIKFISNQAFLSSIDYWKSLQIDFLATNTHFDLAEAYIWSHFRTLHRLAPTSNEYFQAILRVLSFYSNRFEGEIREKHCEKLCEAVNQVKIYSETVFNGLVGGLLAVFQNFNRKISRKTQENLLLTGLNVIKKGELKKRNINKIAKICMKLVKLWRNDKNKALEVLLRLWIWEKTVKRVEFHRKIGKIIEKMLLLSAFDKAESGICREIGTIGAPGVQILRQIYA